jgi:hypothetical protein
MFFGVGHVGRQGIRGRSASGVGPPGMTLDLNFTTPGSFPAGVTFARASTGTYFDSAGVMQTATTNTPRWDYDPNTLQLRGVLIEETRRNLALQSGSLGTAPWTPAAVTVALPVVTNGAVVAPDGTMTGAQIVFPQVTGAGAVSYLRQAMAVTAAVHTFTVYLRGAVGGEQLYLINVDSVAVYYRTQVTLTTTWQRYTLVTGTQVVGSPNFGIGTDLRDASQTTKPAQTIYAWGAQVEVAPCSTSYIPTTGVDATRQVDTCIVNPLGSWFSNAAGTLMVDFDALKTTGTIGGFSTGAFNDSFYYTVPTSNTATAVIGGAGTTATRGGVTLGVPAKVVWSYAPGRLAVVVNGNGPPAQALTLPAGPFPWTTQLVIGAAPWSPTGSNICGHVRAVKYWSRALTDDEMATVTANNDPTLNISFMSSVLDPRITFNRASTGTYFDASGVMQTAAVNAPRWDYDPQTLLLRGLLLEEQRENRTLQSADISNAAWTKASAGGPAAPTVTGNQVVAPDGTTTASRVTIPAVSSAGTVSFVQQALAAGASVAPWTFSVYLRGNVGGEQTYICIYDGITDYRVKQRVTLTTSWQRYVVTSPNNLTTATWYTFIGTDMRDAGETSTPAATIYAWGAQMEQGAFPTSYIPTTGSNLTRAVDLISMPLGSWFDNTKGTMAFDVIFEGFPTTGLTRIAEITDPLPGTANVVSWYPDTTNARYAQVNIIATVTGSATYAVVMPTVGVVNKTAIAYDGSTRGPAVNGVAGTKAGGAIAQGMTLLTWANRPLADRPINMWLRNTRFWPRMMSDAEMQSITS